MNAKKAMDNNTMTLGSGTGSVVSPDVCNVLGAGLPERAAIVISYRYRSPDCRTGKMAASQSIISMVISVVVPEPTILPTSESLLIFIVSTLMTPPLSVTVPAPVFVNIPTLAASVVPDSVTLLFNCKAPV